MTAQIIDLATKRAKRVARPPEELPSTPPQWHLSQRGNPYVVVNEAYHVVLFRRSGAWAFRIEDLETGQAWFSERRYGTQEAARSDALLAVSQLQRKTPERKA